MESDRERYAEQDLAEACRRVAARQRQPNDAQPAAKAINRWIARRGLAAEVSIEELDRCWRSLVGEPLASRTRIGRFSRQALEITVDGAVVMQQLQFQRQRLLEGLQAALPHYGIQRLAFRSGGFEHAPGAT